jgi:hypothetical protein
MYTKLEDANQARKINAYIKANPNATRKLITKHCTTNAHRLKYLEQEGYIVLPLATPRGIRNKANQHTTKKLIERVVRWMTI